MKQFLKPLCAILGVSALVGSLLTTAYTQTVSEELARFRRESRSDIVYLRTRVRELEGELKTSFLDCWAEALENEVSAETEAMTDQAENESSLDTDVDTAEDNAEAGETVTIPTHNSPETVEPDGDGVDTDAPVALYLITVHEGRIGVLDASGSLLRTVNVFVMTLPEAEQEALAVGIPAYSEEELLALLEQYE